MSFLAVERRALYSYILYSFIMYCIILVEESTVVLLLDWFVLSKKRADETRSQGMVIAATHCSRFRGGRDGRLGDFCIHCRAHCSDDGPRQPPTRAHAKCTRGDERRAGMLFGAQSAHALIAASFPPSNDARSGGTLRGTLILVNVLLLFRLRTC